MKLLAFFIIIFLASIGLRHTTDVIFSWHNYDQEIFFKHIVVSLFIAVALTMAKLYFSKKK